MTRRHLLGGIGGLVFGVATLIGLFVASPVGGNYSVSDAQSFVASGHHVAVFVALYLVLLGVAGLIALLACLRLASFDADNERPLLRQLFWGTSLAAAAAFAVGWSVALSPAIAYAQGGSGFSLLPREIYAIGQTGATIVYGPAGILLGVALIILSLSVASVFPSWLRWLTLVVGILGLASPAFFPWFALLIWGVVVGIWLLASGEDTVAA